MEFFGSPTRTFKVRQDDDEGRDISTPFTTASLGTLGFTDAPPAPRKTKKSPNSALLCREIRLKGLGDSADSASSELELVSPIKTSRQVLQARSLNFELSSNDESFQLAEEDATTPECEIPRVRDLTKCFGNVQLGTKRGEDRAALKKKLSFSRAGGAGVLSTPVAAIARPGGHKTPLPHGANHQRKRLYNQISQPPATPAIDFFKEQKTDSSWLN